MPVTCQPFARPVDIIIEELNVPDERRALEEKVAIGRLKQGDIGGLEALVRRYQVAGVRTAFLITRNRALAEEIVQAGFLRVYERIDQFDARRPFGPWFLRIVANDAVKAITRGKDEIPVDSEREESRLAEPTPGPEELLEASETRRAVWDALGKLSPEQRAAIVFRYYLDMNEADMAVRLDCPPGTVKWRLHAARKRLRRLLRPFWLSSPGSWASRRETVPGRSALPLARPNSENSEEV